MAVRELKYSNTNTYLIGGGRKVLLFDTGWAGTFDAFCKAMGELKIPVQYIDYILISHFHPDHCGIAQDIADLGPKIVVMDVQSEYIHAADRIFDEDKRLKFTPIDNSKVKIVHIKESRQFLKECGIDGQIMHTPGHSEDSISLCLDDGSVLVGDLNPLYELEVHKGTLIEDSWNRLLALGPNTVYYGHAKTAHPTPAQLENALKYVAEHNTVLTEDAAEADALTEPVVTETVPSSETVPALETAETVPAAETAEAVPSSETAETVPVAEAAEVSPAPSEKAVKKPSGPEIIRLETAYVSAPVRKSEPVKQPALRPVSKPVTVKAEEPGAVSGNSPVKAGKAIPVPFNIPGPQPALLKPAIPRPEAPKDLHADISEPTVEIQSPQPEEKQTQPPEKVIKEPLSEKEMHKLVERIIKNIDKGYTYDYIARKTGTNDVFVENVARMYLTHPGVGVQGIMDCIELIGIDSHRD